MGILISFVGGAAKWRALLCMGGSYLCVGVFLIGEGVMGCWGRVFSFFFLFPFLLGGGGWVSGRARPRVVGDAVEH